MRQFTTCAMAVLLFALAACQQGPGGTGAPQPAGKAPVNYTGRLPTPSPYQVRQITAGGDYRHDFTGLVFPDRVGQLKRIFVVVGTANGDDVGATYRLPGRDDFIVTALVFPIWNVVDRPLTIDDVPAACADGYHDAKEMARRRLDNARVVDEGPISVPRFGDAVFTQFVSFDADGGANLADFPVRSSLYVQCGVGKVWVVQYRVTFAPGLDGAESLARDFMAAVPIQP